MESTRESVSLPRRKYLLCPKFHLSMILWYFNPIEICQLSSKKSQQNLLYKLIQKDNFILFLSLTPDAPPLCYLSPHCAADQGTNHRRQTLPTSAMLQKWGNHKSNCSLFGSSLSHVLTSQAEANDADAD